MRYRYAYEIKPDGTVRLLRAYGRENVVILPEKIGDRYVTETAAYMFSAHRDGEPEGALYWEGEVKMAETDDPEKRWDILEQVWRAENWTACEEENDSPKPICGPELSCIVFPDSVRQIGRYQFYNCEGLRTMRIPTTLCDIGGGAFNGCRKVQDLVVRVFVGKKSGLREILTELNETLTVHYYEEDGVPHESARLLFPEYFEEAIENTPARQLVTEVHGCGHRYRYCFQNTHFVYSEYDRLFFWVKEQESVKLGAELAIDRLRFPRQLSEKTRADYRSYLKERWPEVTAFLVKRDDPAMVRYLAEDEETSAEELDLLTRAAQGEGRTGMVSDLMGIRHRRFAPKRHRIEAF